MIKKLASSRYARLRVLYTLLSVGLGLTMATGIQAQKKAERQARAVLEQQIVDWNEGDLEGFMQGYWKDDDLVFMSSRGARQGWDALMKGYSKGYPDASAMGSLGFEDLVVRQQSRRVVTVHGRFVQTPSGEDAKASRGYFLLVLKRIKGDWVVIYDHTSVSSE